MTKKELIEALDGLDDDAVIQAEIELCVLGHRSMRSAELTVKNVYSDCVILGGTL